jgi:alkaline phosphatase
VIGGGPDAPLFTGLEEWTKAGTKGQMRLPAIRTENSHTGEEVPVLATGAGSERVKGFVPNTQIFHIMMDAFGWKPSASPRPTD